MNGDAEKNGDIVGNKHQNGNDPTKRSTFDRANDNHLYHEKVQETPNSFSCCQRLSYHVSNGIGEAFYRLGYKVALHPWRTIIIAWLVVGICSTGFTFFHNEKDPMKLWVPKNSKFLQDTEWLMHRFEERTREQKVLITAPNVLDPAVLQKLAIITDEITNLTAFSKNNSLITWNDVCFKIPLIADFTAQPKRRRRRRREAKDDQLDMPDDFSDDFFDDRDEDEYEEYEEDTVGGNQTNPISNNKPHDGSPSNNNNLNNNNDKKKDSNNKKERPFNPSYHLDPSYYCDIINKLKMGCFQHNLLDMWKYNRAKIGKLSPDEVLKKLNQTKVSPVTGHDVDYLHMLSGIVRNETGHVVAASGILVDWMLYVNVSDVNPDKSGNLAGTEDWAPENALLWEQRFLEIMERLQRELSVDGVQVYYAAGRSYGDVSAKAMFQDMDKLTIGVTMMFIFMQLVLSKFSWVELRLILGVMGLLSVGMAFIAGAGVCSFLGISYGPVHTSLPFLLLGLGVDDMFVMMAGWRRVQALHSDLTLPEKMGTMLRHAGTSITVTSLTDICAFIVGATTILPSLKSFCLYAAMSILTIYLYVITFFVAIFTLDERRIAAKRNAIIPCIVHSDEKTKPCYQKNLMTSMLECVFSKFVFTKAGRIVVIMSVIAVTSFSVESLLHLRQKFDATWFIPQQTYYYKYVMQTRELYPESGSEAMVLIGKLNYTLELPKIYQMSEMIANSTDEVHELQSWTKPFQEFVFTYYDKDIRTEHLTDYEWRKFLSKFLYSSSGGKFQANFRFENKLKCGQPTPNVTVATFDFKYRRFYDREDYLPAKQEMDRIVDDTHLATGEGFSTVWAKIYGTWITDEIIDEEILRNICLALVGVMACTAVLIVNFQVCFWIFVCVLLTLINVGGFMYRWGLTLDIVSCIALQLSVGLCVDYAAHVGHTFLTVTHGTRTERAMECIVSIGAAVIYGGTSTVLSLSILVFSEAYTYRLFFKIFFLVVCFGLFHGIVLLPVILSLIGPAPYASHKRTNSITDKQHPPGGEGEEMISFTKRKPSVSTIDVTGIVVSAATRLSSDNGGAGKKLLNGTDVVDDEEMQSLNPK